MKDSLHDIIVRIILAALSRDANDEHFHDLSQLEPHLTPEGKYAIREAVLKFLVANKEGKLRGFIHKKGVPDCDTNIVLNTFWMAVMRFPIDKLGMELVLFMKLSQVIADYFKGKGTMKIRMVECLETPPEIAVKHSLPEPRDEAEEEWLTRRFYEEHPCDLDDTERLVLFRGLRGHSLEQLGLRLGLSVAQVKVIMRRALRRFRATANKKLENALLERHKEAKSKRRKRKSA